MGANIELWQYRLYENGALYFEEIYKPIRSHRTVPKTHADGPEASSSDSSLVVPTFESHISGKPDFVIRWANDLREFIFSLDESIEEVPRKMYIAYRASSNIAGIEYQRKSVGIYLKLKPEDIDVGKEIYRDVTNIGTYAPGTAEFTITEDKHLEIVKLYIRKAYNKLGG
jgi:predicted transport protein